MHLVPATMSVPVVSFVMWASPFVITTPVRNILWIVCPVVDALQMGVFAKYSPKFVRTMKIVPMASFVMVAKVVLMAYVKLWEHIPPVRLIHHRAGKRSMFVAVLVLRTAPPVSVMMNALFWTNV